MHLAVAKGYVEKIALLITYGANVNQVEKSKGYSPLHIACETGNVEVVNLLINNGANVNQNDEVCGVELVEHCFTFFIVPEYSTNCSIFKCKSKVCFNFD